MTNIAAFTWRRQKSRYNMVGKRCGRCNTLYFPPRGLCRRCDPPQTTEDFKLSGLGKIESYTSVHAPPEEQASSPPYILAIVRTDEGPGVTSQIVECKEDDIYIGMPVEMVLRKMTEDEGGLITYGFKFRPLLVNGGSHPSKEKVFRGR